MCRPTAEATPLQRARMLAAGRAIVAGEIVVHLRCGWCESPSLDRDPDVPDRLCCITCGKTTRLQTAREDRKRRIQLVIREGVDLPTRGA